MIWNPDHVESHDLPDDPIAARCAAALLRCFPRYRARFLINDIVAHTREADTEVEAENGLWQSIEREARAYRGVDFRAFARDLIGELRWTEPEAQALVHAFLFAEHRIYELMGIRRIPHRRRGRPVVADRLTRSVWCLAEAWCRVTGGSPSTAKGALFERAASIAAHHLRWQRRDRPQEIRQMHKLLTAEFGKLRRREVVFTPQYFPVTF